MRRNDGRFSYALLAGFRGLLTAAWFGLACRIERDRGADQRLEGVGVDLPALFDVDRTPDIAVETGIEQPGRVRQSRALGKRQLPLPLVRLAGTADAGIRPGRQSVG